MAGAGGGSVVVVVVVASFAEGVAVAALEAVVVAVEGVVVDVVDVVDAVVVEEAGDCLVSEGVRTTAPLLLLLLFPRSRLDRGRFTDVMGV